MLSRTTRAKHYGTLSKMVSKKQVNKKAKLRNIIFQNFPVTASYLDFSWSNVGDFEFLIRYTRLMTLDVSHTLISSLKNARISTTLEDLRIAGSPLADYIYYRLMCLICIGVQLRVIDGENILPIERNFVKRYAEETRDLLLEGFILASVDPVILIKDDERVDIVDGQADNKPGFTARRIKIKEGKALLEEITRALNMQAHRLNATNRPINIDKALASKTKVDYANYIPDMPNANRNISPDRAKFSAQIAVHAHLNSTGNISGLNNAAYSTSPIIKMDMHQSHRPNGAMYSLCYTDENGFYVPVKNHEKYYFDENGNLIPYTEGVNNRHSTPGMGISYLSGPALNRANSPHFQKIPGSPGLLKSPRTPNDTKSVRYRGAAEEKSPFEKTFYYNISNQPDYYASSVEHNSPEKREERHHQADQNFSQEHDRYNSSGYNATPKPAHGRREGSFISGLYDSRYNSPQIINNQLIYDKHVAPRYAIEGLEVDQMKTFAQQISTPSKYSGRDLMIDGNDLLESDQKSLSKESDKVSVNDKYSTSVTGDKSSRRLDSRSKDETKSAASDSRGGLNQDYKSRKGSGGSGTSSRKIETASQKGLEEEEKKREEINKELTEEERRTKEQGTKESSDLVGNIRIVDKDRIEAGGGEDPALHGEVENVAVNGSNTSKGSGLSQTKKAKISQTEDMFEKQTGCFCAPCRTKKKAVAKAAKVDPPPDDVKQNAPEASNDKVNEPATPESKNEQSNVLENPGSPMFAQGSKQSTVQETEEERRARKEKRRLEKEERRRAREERRKEGYAVSESSETSVSTQSGTCSSLNGANEEKKARKEKRRLEKEERRKAREEKRKMGLPVSESSETSTCSRSSKHGNPNETEEERKARKEKRRLEKEERRKAKEEKKKNGLSVSENSDLSIGSHRSKNSNVAETEEEKKARMERRKLEKEEKRKKKEEKIKPKQIEPDSTSQEYLIDQVLKDHEKSEKEQLKRESLSDARGKNVGTDYSKGNEHFASEEVADDEGL